MILRTTELKRYRLTTADGPVGQVEDVFFTDDTWDIRYVVVGARQWLPGSGVLISPVAVAKTDWTRREIEVDLTFEQVKTSPPLESDGPVSRQFEIALHDHYRWPPYWEGPVGASTPAAREARPGPERSSDGSGGSRLRSANEVGGYGVDGVDGNAGWIEDVAVDLEHWRIPWFVVATRRWLLRRRVPVPVAEVERLSPAEQRAYVGLPKKTIRKTTQVVV